jgi:hypothetical protein
MSDFSVDVERTRRDLSARGPTRKSTRGVVWTFRETPDIERLMQFHLRDIDVELPAVRSD